MYDKQFREELEQRRKSLENAAEANISRFRDKSGQCRLCNGARVIYRAIASDFDRFYDGSDQDKERDPRFRAEPCPMCAGESDQVE